jgi:hypothetical protein
LPVRPPGGGSGGGPGTGKPFFNQGWLTVSSFSVSVASTPKNPFTDSHAVSTLTGTAVEQIDMTVYSKDGDTNGRLWFSFLATKHADY